MYDLELEGIKVNAPIPPAYEEILTAGALSFIGKLARAFTARRDRLLCNRMKRQADLDRGIWPDFLEETKAVREGDWAISDLPEDLKDRRVEITGPAGDRKMVINALNSGAKVFMADFEDASSPTWKNMIQGQINLRDAIRGTIQFTSENGKTYRLQENPAVLVVRPRGLHLDEHHIWVDGQPVPGGLVDFGLYFYHNASLLIKRGSGPYFYLPKLESHLEARFWNDVFLFAQHELGIPRGTIKATVLIETIMAAFEMDEILYELREHSAGLNCGRWDYIFSFIKRLRNFPEVILPDRASVTMTAPFMRAYSLLAIKTCHRRNAPCIGGMAAQIPVKNDPGANERAKNSVRLDKEREAKDGHDGTWVAHPGLVPVAREVFDRFMPGPNQIGKQREDVAVSAKDLLKVPKGKITEKGLRTNIRVAILYLEAWIRGFGAVGIDHLMEDAATAEISRAQVWQWIRHEKGVLEDGRNISPALVREMIGEEMEKLKNEVGEQQWPDRKFEEARRLFSELVFDSEFAEFLTLPGSGLLFQFDQKG
ncbi:MULTISPECIES: malate synthase A [unclassified Thermoactinomyces]|jgi:malate synthase|uniref:malate synthase A n=1 Tax=unclassified Thermoactinomyces TaxID=2634588 RepID=UPI0018DC1C54|nr:MULTISPECIES: malate synthase A [unclassified Thermoactinomyces]MBH8605005.1 malate synthase A [Thermoactinomyces sp. CICC 10522]MBH8608445.1 malate synthase A [Thermoactinomyces sp. CICC 10521]